MTPDSPNSSREELEARLTALLLGELPEDEAAALRQAIAQDADLAQLHDRLQQAIALVRETVAEPETETAAITDVPKLAAERREKLLASFKAGRPKESEPSRWRSDWSKAKWREFAALAAMLVGLLAVGGMMIGREGGPFRSFRMMTQLAREDGNDFGTESRGRYYAGENLFRSRAKAIAGASGPEPGSAPPNRSIRLSEKAPSDRNGGAMNGLLNGSGFTASLYGGPSGPPVNPTVAVPPPPALSPVHSPAPEIEVRRSLERSPRQLASIALPTLGDLAQSDSDGVSNGREKERLAGASQNVPSDFFQSVSRGDFGGAHSSLAGGERSAGGMAGGAMGGGGAGMLGRDVSRSIGTGNEPVSGRSADKQLPSQPAGNATSINAWAVNTSDSGLVANDFGGPVSLAVRMPSTPTPDSTPKNDDPRFGNLDRNGIVTLEKKGGVAGVADNEFMYLNGAKDNRPKLLAAKPTGPAEPGLAPTVAAPRAAAIEDNVQLQVEGAYVLSTNMIVNFATAGRVIAPAPADGWAGIAPQDGRFYGFGAQPTPTPQSSFRSGLLLDQDRAVRGRDLAATSAGGIGDPNALGVFSHEAVGYINIDASKGIAPGTKPDTDSDSANRFSRLRRNGAAVADAKDAPAESKKLAEVSKRESVPGNAAIDTLHFDAPVDESRSKSKRESGRALGEKAYVADPMEDDVKLRKSRVDIALPAGERSEVGDRFQVATGPVTINEINYSDPATGLPKQEELGRRTLKRSSEETGTDVPQSSTEELQLREADLSQVLDAYQKVTGRSVLKPASLPPAKISIPSQTQLTRAETVQALDSILAMNGIAMVPQGDKFVKAMPEGTANNTGKKFDDIPWELLPESGKIVTHLVQLSNTAPQEVATVLQQFAKLPGNSVVALPTTSMLVLRDYEENVNRMEQMIQRLDVVPQQEFVDVVIPIEFAQARDVAQLLGSLTTGSGGVATVGSQPTRTGVSGGIGGLWDGQTGYKPTQSSGNTANRSSFAQRLNQSVNRAAGAAGDGDAVSLGQTKIIADERSNSLLVFASKDKLTAISNIIGKLDKSSIPTPEVITAERAFSTFSLNVSDVSFKLAAASLEKGQMPDPATVRSEEFINAFDYRDPDPKGSAPIAFTWERARYPFAHDRDLVRFSVKTAASGRQPGRPLNLVLLLDNSGSMERADRVRIIQECLRVLAGQLQAQDRVSVVAFARTARLWVDGLPGNQAGELPQRVGGLTPQGGTNLEDAMNLAYQTALRHYLAQGVNRVVLLTDGAANLGDVQPESLKKKVETHRQQGIALDCFGIGWEGFNDELLETLSRNGDGRYGFVNTPEAATSEFAGQLAGALKVAASDVKVQVEFNPRRATGYRQIGYAKHQLKKEQFRDNTVDAAEIGAAEAGNALYLVQVNPAGEGPIGTVRVRFKVPGTSDYREHEWPVPYEGAARSLEQSSAALRLAASASAFSEWLVSSPYAGEVTPDKLLGYLNGVPETWPADPRPKKLEWMIRQAKSVAGK